MNEPSMWEVIVPLLLAATLGTALGWFYPLSSQSMQNWIKGVSIVIVVFYFVGAVKTGDPATVKIMMVSLCLAGFMATFGWLLH